jgi:hypothetical protein
MSFLKKFFSLFSSESQNKALNNKQVEEEAIKRAFETGNAVIARRNKDGSITWREIEIK